MNAVGFLRAAGALFAPKRAAAGYANPALAPFGTRTSLETLLIDEDFYLAECAVIRPRADAPDRADRRARR